MKFRGKKDNGKGWAYGGLALFDWGAFLIEYNSFEQRNRVDYDTLGRLSPFADKDGRPIYEGDILQEGLDKAMLVCFGLFAAGKDDWGISFMVYGWHVRFADGDVYCISQDSEGYCIRTIECTVVGNKHDNPELLTNEQMKS